MGQALADAFPRGARRLRAGRRRARRPALEALLRGARGGAHAHREHPAGDPAASIAALRGAASAHGRCGPTFVAGHSLGEYSRARRRGRARARRRGPAGAPARQVHAGGRARRAWARWRPSWASAAAEVAAACEEAAGGEVVRAGQLQRRRPDRDRRARGGGRARVRGWPRRAGRSGPIPLTVSAPFHCALMQPAAERLAAELARVEVAAPAFPVVTNVEAAPNQDPARVRRAAGAAGDGAGALGGVGRAPGRAGRHARARARRRARCSPGWCSGSRPTLTVRVGGRSRGHRGAGGDAREDRAECVSSTARWRS